MIASRGAAISGMHDSDVTAEVALRPLGFRKPHAPRDDRLTTATCFENVVIGGGTVMFMAEADDGWWTHVSSASTYWSGLDLYVVRQSWYSSWAEVTMAPYLMDLRERVVRAWDASGDADEGVGSPLGAAAA